MPRLLRLAALERNGRNLRPLDTRSRRRHLRQPRTLARRQRPSPGHISIYADEHTLIQATDGQGSWAGVHEGEQDYDAGWANYWLYGLMPDVDYDGVDQPETMVVTPEEVPSVATEFEVNWFGIGADDYVRLGGDYTKGWIGQTKDRTLIRVV